VGRHVPLRVASKKRGTATPSDNVSLAARVLIIGGSTTRRFVLRG
jgi:hypothetical protein